MKEYNQRPEVKARAAIRRTDPQYKEEARLRAVRWRRENPERDLQNVRNYIAAHPEWLKEARRRRRMENPESTRARDRARSARYNARKVNAPAVPFTVEQLASKVTYWGGRCWICGGNWNAIDHVKPLARGGSHMLCNLRPICTGCNSKKGSKWPIPTRAQPRRDCAREAEGQGQRIRV